MRGRRSLGVLTPREATIVQGVMDGLTNKLIAFRFKLSINTVKINVSRIMHKLGVKNRCDLARWGFVYQQQKAALFAEQKAAHEAGRMEIEPSEDTTLKMNELTDYDVFRSMAKCLKLTPQQYVDISEIILAKGRISPAEFLV